MKHLVNQMQSFERLSNQPLEQENKWESFLTYVKVAREYMQRSIELAGQDFQPDEVDFDDVIGTEEVKNWIAITYPKQANEFLDKVSTQGVYGQAMFNITREELVKYLGLNDYQANRWKEYWNAAKHKSYTWKSSKNIQSELLQPFHSLFSTDTSELKKALTESEKLS